MFTEGPKNYQDLCNAVGSQAIESVLDFLLSKDMAPHRSEPMADRFIEKFRQEYGDEQLWYFLSNLLQSALAKDMIEVGLDIDYDQESRSKLNFKQLDIDYSDRREAMFVFKGQDSTYTLLMNHKGSTD